MAFQITSKKAVKRLSSLNTAPEVLLIIVSNRFRPRKRYFPVVFHEKLRILTFQFAKNYDQENIRPLVDLWFGALGESSSVSHISSLILSLTWDYTGSLYRLNDSFARLPLGPQLGSNLRHLEVSNVALSKKLCGFLGRTLPLFTQLEKIKIDMSKYMAADGLLLTALVDVPHFDICFCICSHPEAFLDFRFKKHSSRNRYGKSSLFVELNGLTMVDHCALRTLFSAAVAADGVKVYVAPRILDEAWEQEIYGRMSTSN